MPGRRAVAAAALVSAAVFGGGAALAATHGNAKPVVKQVPAVRRQPQRQQPRATHHCHLWDTNPGAANAALDL